jgi:NCS1 family nucleobase:cation symporter-1
MALSRAAFGQRGNLLRGALIWVARWGWETINAVTGAYALLIVVTLLLFVTATLAISGLGIDAVQRCTMWATWLFGVFSVLVLGRLLVDTDRARAFGRGPGPVSAVVTGIGLVAAGGMSWAPAAPDFTRHLPGTASSAAIVRNTVNGAGIVVLPMGLMGAVMAAELPDLAATADPASFLGEILPLWLAVPYLLIALVAMLLINAMSMCSAGFTAQTLGFRV